MKTLQELYKEIVGNDELKKAFTEAEKAGKIPEFVKAKGVEATAEEIKAFRAARAEDECLSPEELDAAAGGGTCEDTLMHCVTCKKCGKRTLFDAYNDGRAIYCAYCGAELIYAD